MINYYKWLHSIIKEKIIQIARKENKVQILYKLSKYGRKYNKFTKKHLWSDIN